MPNGYNHLEMGHSIVMRSAAKTKDVTELEIILFRFFPLTALLWI